MITPYGNTSFEFGGTDMNSDGYQTSPPSPNRYLDVTLPNGGHDLWVFRVACTDFMASTNSPYPSTSPFANTFDNSAPYNNSFHWGPLQYAALSTNNPVYLTAMDYSLAEMRHWLTDPLSFQPAPAVGVHRDPSPNGSVQGQLTFFDYIGKPDGYNNMAGSNTFPSLSAKPLPDGTTWFQKLERNDYGSVTNDISTYSLLDGSIGLRTNKFIYYGNQIDLQQHVGPQGEQVVSNYVNNSYHQEDRSYDALNQETVYTYSANRQIIKKVTPSGLTTTNIYFPSGSDIDRLDTTIDIEINRTNSFTYANGLVQTHTDARGMKSTNFWDNLQRLTGTACALGTTTNLYYRLDGTSFPNSTGGTNILDRTASKDRLDHWTYTEVNSIRQPISETNKNGVVTRYGYCACGALLFLTNAWNTSIQQVTSFDYDNQGNRIFIGGADGYNNTNNFNVLRQLTNSTDGTISRTFFYNNQSLQTVVSNDYGIETATVFDSHDRVSWSTNGDGVSLTNTWDLLGRISTRTYPDAGVELFGYSARGLTVHTNQIGATNFYAYDTGSRKIAETNANGEVVLYTNNAASDLLTITDGKGQTTRWNYDEFGRVTNKLDQAGIEILRYQYDSESRLTNRWSKEKLNTKYGYDPVGNLTNIDYNASTDVRFGFDALNRMTSMVDAVGTTLFTWTAGNQLLTEDGPFTSDTVTNTYQNRLRVALALQQPTSFWTNGFGYDLARRLTNVTMSAGSFSYAYPAGMPSLLPIKILLPNTSFVTNNYDSVARLLTTALKNSANGTLDSYTYVYNLANQRTNLTRTDGSTVAFSYDNIGQLTIANSSVNSEDRGYFYDAAWNLNRRTNNGVLSTFSVDSKNQISTCPDGVAAYDNNGNLTTTTSPTSYTFTYDDENRLTAAKSGTSWRYDFVYDGLGRKRSRTDYTWNGSSWVTGATTQYIYDGKRVIQERVSGTPTVAYTRGIDLSGSMEGAGGIGGLLARSSSYVSGNFTNHNYYHADANGNVTYLVNGSQTLAASYRYDPFGNLVAASGTLALDNTFRFSSKEVLASGGLYDFLYRWYAPNMQRWLNRDPLGDIASAIYVSLGSGVRFSTLNNQESLLGRLVLRKAQDTPNPFVDVANDPIDSCDPFGLDPVSGWRKWGWRLGCALGGAAACAPLLAVPALGQVLYAACVTLFYDFCINHPPDCPPPPPPPTPPLV